MPRLSDSSISSHAIQKAVNDLCDGPVLSRAPAAIRLLRFLVEREQSGKLDRLRETVIGHELYGRDQAYDPKLDAVVRVNATRLRQRLEEHYRLFPQTSVRIILRSGSYVPSYQETPEPQPETQPTPQPEIQPTPPPPPVTPLPSTIQPPANVWWTGRLLAALSLAVLCLLAALWKVSRRAPPTPPREVWSVRPFARGTGSQQFADFSPDGKTLVFAATRPGNAKKSIYIQDLSSDTARLLLDEPEDQTRPVWSPDGKFIAFLRMGDHGAKQIMVASPASGQPVPIAAIPIATIPIGTIQGSFPWLCEIPRLTWARDGRTLYSSAVPSQGGSCGIVAIDLASHQLRQLTTPPAGINGDLEAAVSPDGSTLAFLRNISFANSDIFLMSLDGTHLRQLTHDGSDIVGFAWSSDGKSLVLASNRLDGQRKLWNVPLDGEPPQPLTDGSSAPAFPAVNPSANQMSFTQYNVSASIWQQSEHRPAQPLGDGGDNDDPSISPDGRRLLFISGRSGPWTVWISDIHGSGARRLLRDPAIQATDARWSPDGKHIAFECSAAGKHHICLTDEAGFDVKSLTSGPSAQTLPSWSHDGTSVYYTSGSSGSYEIYRQDLSGGSPARITYDGGLRALESADGRSVYVFQQQPRSGIVALPAHPDPDSQPAAGKKLFLLPMEAKHSSDWIVAGDAIFYLADPLSVRFPPGAPVLCRYDLTTHQSRPLFALTALGSEPGSEHLSGVYGTLALYTRQDTKAELKLMNVDPPGSEPAPRPTAPR